ncbi:unnamed protein product [Ectocarpus sp. CCAP 1310/34]|nr:unnamed protein product [Ectocarpus sp. CCAP 1310/34]
MFSASRGALARSRKSDALVTRYRAALLDDNEKQRRLNDETRKLKLRISVLEAELKEAKQNEESVKEAAGTAPGVVGIDHNLLRALQPVGVRSLVGLSDHESLEVSVLRLLCASSEYPRPAAT